MKNSDLASGSARLYQAWEQLRDRWETTKLTWHDNVSQDFEQRYLAALEAQLVATVQRMRALATMVNVAEKECDDEAR